MLQGLGLASSVKQVMGAAYNKVGHARLRLDLQTATRFSGPCQRRYVIKR
jgi:hypothetical protein